MISSIRSVYRKKAVKVSLGVWELVWELAVWVVEVFFDRGWVVLVFEGEYAFGQGFGAVVGENGAMGLEQVVAVVVMFIDPVNGDAGFGFPGGQYGCVDVNSVHALSTIFGQEGRMDVQDSIGVGLNQGIGYFPQKSGQDKSVNLSRLEFGEVSVSI